MDDERDYALLGEDVGTDPASYGVIDADEAGDGPTEFGLKPGEIPAEEEDVHDGE